MFLKKLQRDSYLPREGGCVLSYLFCRGLVPHETSQILHEYKGESHHFQRGCFGFQIYQIKSLATHCDASHHDVLPVMHHITLQSMATCCDTSQHIAMHGNTL
jgi:hypothetical protein